MKTTFNCLKHIMLRIIIILIYLPSMLIFILLSLIDLVLYVFLGKVELSDRFRDFFERLLNKLDSID